MKNAITRSFSLPVPASEAFDTFMDLDRWWPREYTWSGNRLVHIGIEHRVDGMCHEVGPFGFRCDWGRVLVLERPSRLIFTWQIGPHREPVPNPVSSSDVEVRFAEESPTTSRVEFEHRGFERHGEDGETYRRALEAPEGWTYILGRYQAALGVGGLAVGQSGGRR